MRMVFPLIIGSIVALSSAGIISYGISKIEPDTQQSNQYIHQTQIKNNEIIIGSNSKVNTIQFKDTMTQQAHQEAKLTSTKDNTLLYVVGAVIGSYFIIGGLRK